MEEKQLIEQLVHQYQECVHTQDREDFDQVFSTSAECSLISIGTLYSGREAIYNDFLVGGIRSHYEVIDLIAEDIAIRLLDETHAIIIFQYHTECIRRESKEYYSIQGLETQVAIKEDGQWKLVHVHYSKV